MDASLLILIAIGIVVCTLALRPKSQDIGSGDYSGWDFDGDN